MEWILDHSLYTYTEYLYKQLLLLEYLTQFFDGVISAKTEL